MMNFTDLTGLAGIALAIVTLSLQLPLLTRLQPKQKLGWVIALFVTLGIPFDGLSFAEFVRGATGDLSITTLLLLTLTLLRFSFGESSAKSGQPTEGAMEPQVIRANKKSLLGLITLASVVLYPLALGISTFDPYRLGFGNSWFITGLLIVVLTAWFRQYALIALSIALAVLAWSVGWYESNNLWNYLLDPWVAIYALIAFTRKNIRSVLRSKSL